LSDERNKGIGHKKICFCFLGLAVSDGQRRQHLRLQQSVPQAFGLLARVLHLSQLLARVLKRKPNNGLKILSKTKQLFSLRKLP
jgi:glutamine synthetase adenylyltransferase